MSKTASAGSAKRTVDPNPKHLGFKKFGDEIVEAGNIILRQRGTKFHPGKNVGMGKDHTLFAKLKGQLKFRRMTGHKRSQQYVDVIPA
jgi:large subunit ribosomal protein L27